MRPPRTTLTSTAPTAAILAALVATTLSLQACSSPARSASANHDAARAASRPAPATYGTVSRELASAEQANIDRVVAAARDALRDLELRDVNATKDGLLATVSARTIRDERVTVSLSRMTTGVTDVRIKVGFWGDEPRSRSILAEIRKNLALTPTPETDTVLPPIHALAAPPTTTASTADSTTPARHATADHALR